MAPSEAILESNNFGDATDDAFQYRPLSTAALASVVFGVVSALTFLAGNNSLQACLMLCPIPILGLICGLVALKKIRQLPDQLSGCLAAVAGTVMSTLGLVGGLSYAGYVHATEVPPGYERLSFHGLRPDDIERRGNETVPRNVVALDGQDVFIKGFMRPAAHYSQEGSPVSRNVSRFLLVRDSNECCFGDISTVKYYDKLEVQLKQGLFTDYSSGMFRVTGKLRIEPAKPLLGRPEPVYSLEADYVR